MKQSECLWSIQVIYESQNISVVFHSGSVDKLHTNLMKEIGEKHYNWLILIGFVAFLRCTQSEDGGLNFSYKKHGWKSIAK